MNTTASTASTIGITLPPTSAAPERGTESRWMRDLLVLQVTSIFSAALFVAVWLLH